MPKAPMCAMQMPHGLPWSRQLAALPPRDNKQRRRVSKCTVAHGESEHPSARGRRGRPTGPHAERMQTRPPRHAAPRPVSRRPALPPASGPLQPQHKPPARRTNGGGALRAGRPRRRRHCRTATCSSSLCHDQTKRRLLLSRLRPPQPAPSDFPPPPRTGKMGCPGMTAGTAAASGAPAARPWRRASIPRVIEAAHSRRRSPRLRPGLAPQGGCPWSGFPVQSAVERGRGVQRLGRGGEGAAS